MANTLRRDPYWFDRILEEITYKFDPEDPRHPAGLAVAAGRERRSTRRDP